MKKIFLTLTAAALLSGCATVRYSEMGDRMMVDIENTCWMAFFFIPLASGEPKHPNEETFRLFQNSATLDNNMKMLDSLRQRKGAVGVRDLTSRFNETSYIFFLKRYSCQTSAELVRAEESKERPNENYPTRPKIESLHAR